MAEVVSTGLVSIVGLLVLNTGVVSIVGLVVEVVNTGLVSIVGHVVGTGVDIVVYIVDGTLVVD